MQTKLESDKKSQISSKFAAQKNTSGIFIILLFKALFIYGATYHIYLSYVVTYHKQNKLYPSGTSVFEMSSQSWVNKTFEWKKNVIILNYN